MEVRVLKRSWGPVPFGLMTVAESAPRRRALRRAREALPSRPLPELRLALEPASAGERSQPQPPPLQPLPYAGSAVVNVNLSLGACFAGGLAHSVLHAKRGGIVSVGEGVREL